METREQKKQRQANNAVHRATYQARKDAGLCTRCGKRWAEAGRSKCRPCAEKARKYYLDNNVREYLYQYTRMVIEERRKNGQCTNCGEKLTETERAENTRCARCRRKNMERLTVARIKMRIHGIKRKY